MSPRESLFDQSAQLTGTLSLTGAGPWILPDGVHADDRPPTGCVVVERVACAGECLLDGRQLATPSAQAPSSPENSGLARSRRTGHRGREWLARLRVTLRQTPLTARRRPYRPPPRRECRPDQEVPCAASPRWTQRLADDGHSGPELLVDEQTGSLPPGVATGRCSWHAPFHVTCRTANSRDRFRQDHLQALNWRTRLPSRCRPDQVVTSQRRHIERRASSDDDQLQPLSYSG